MRKQMKLYLGLFLSATVICAGLLCNQKVDASSDADNIYTYDEYTATYQEKDSNGFKLVPVDNEGTDTVFAGWYKDAEFTQAVSADDTFEGEGDLYAKFVDKDVLSLVYQVEKEAYSTIDSEDGAWDVRLLTSVDSKKYESVGFYISGIARTSDTVYNTIVGFTDEGANFYHASDVFSEKSIRFATYTLNDAQNIANVHDATEQFGWSFDVQPTWTTLDGTIVKGDTYTIELNDEFYEAEVDDVLTGETGGTQHRWGTLNDLVTQVNDDEDGETLGGVGTDAESIVITLKDDVTLTGRLYIQKNIQIVNEEGEEVKIIRGFTTSSNSTHDMFYLSDGSQIFTLGSLDSAATGKLIIDASSTDAIKGRTLEVRTGTSFILGYNATLMNANSTETGAAIVNRGAGTVTLYGNMINNVSSKSGGAGAILQTRGCGVLTIETGTYIGNKNISTSGTGGLIGAQAKSGESSPGEVKINGGIFSENEATNGGVMYAPNGQKLTVTGGTYTGNKATAGGVFYVVDNGSVSITNATITENEASTESTDSVAGGGAICLSNADLTTPAKVTLKNTIVDGNTADGKADCDIVFSMASNTSKQKTSLLNLKGYESFDGIVGWYGAGSVDSATNVVFLSNDDETLRTATLEHGTQKYVSYLDADVATELELDQYSLVSGVAQFSANERNYYFDSLENAVDYVQADNTIGGAGADVESIVITLLDNVTLTKKLSISENIQITNAESKNVTIMRGFTSGYTNNDMFTTPVDTNSTLTIGSMDEKEKGTITVDATSTEAIKGRTLDVRGTTTFILGYNATLQGANSTETGAVIVNRGTVTLYGTIKDNQSSKAGGAGAILQVKNATCPLTIEAGTYTNNKNTSTTGKGGFIGSQGSASEVKIKGGTFSGNEATYGGVMYAPNGQKLTVTGGTFTGNKATAGGVFYIVDNGNISVTNATITGNEASVESADSVAGGGAICLSNEDLTTPAKVTLKSSIVTGNTADGKAGCDIVFSFASNTSKTKTSQLNLKEFESFDGIIGWYGAGTVGSKADVNFIDGSNDTLGSATPEHGKSYTVDCANYSLTAIE